MMMIAYRAVLYDYTFNIADTKNFVDLDLQRIVRELCPGHFTFSNELAWDNDVRYVDVYDD